MSFWRFCQHWKVCATKRFRLCRYYFGWRKLPSDRVCDYCEAVRSGWNVETTGAPNSFTSCRCAMGSKAEAARSLSSSPKRFAKVILKQEEVPHFKPTFRNTKLSPVCESPVKETPMLTLDSVKTPARKEDLATLPKIHKKRSPTLPKITRAERECIMCIKSKKQKRCLRMNERLSEEGLYAKRVRNSPDDCFKWLINSPFFRPNLTNVTLLTYPLTAQSEGEEYELPDVSEMCHVARRIASFHNRERELRQQRLWPGPLAESGYYYDNDSGSIVCYYCRHPPGRHSTICNWSRCNVPLGSTAAAPLERIDLLQMMGVTPRASNQPGMAASGQEHSGSHEDRNERLRSLGPSCPQQIRVPLADAGFYLVNRRTVRCFACGLLLRLQDLRAPPGEEDFQHLMCKHKQGSPHCPLVRPPPASAAAVSPCLPQETIHGTRTQPGPDTTGEELCVLCHDRQASVRARRCGHFVLCQICVNQRPLALCPACREGTDETSA